MMRLPVLVLAAAAIWLGACTGAIAGSASRPNVLAYGCTDLVAVGRGRTLGYAPIEDENALLGHGVFSLEVEIRWVVKGAERRRQVQAKRVAHAQMRDDLDFLLVLSPSADGGYVLRSAALWDRPRPVLADKCE